MLKSYLETRVGCGAPNQLDAAVHRALWPAKMICSEEENMRRYKPATLRPTEHLHLTETKVLSIRAIVPENLDSSFFSLLCYETWMNTSVKA